MKRPDTFDEFLDLVHQAVYEVDELRACIEDDYEDMARYMPFLDGLDNQLRQLFTDMTAGKFENFGMGRDLPFMPILLRFERDIPFRDLLRTINQTYREGLRV
ncbi:MAG TPA: hypothetical protein VEP67_01145 [Thiobacillaceae bacterium]|nr:hypothetical protein [Thiobacillaceae bacterium]